MRSGQLPIANRLQPDLLLLDRAPSSPLESEFYNLIVLRTSPSRVGLVCGADEESACSGAEKTQFSWYLFTDRVPHDDVSSGLSHKYSHRRKKTFVKINCAALSVESRLIA